MQYADLFSYGRHKRAGQTPVTGANLTVPIGCTRVRFALDRV